MNEIFEQIGGIKVIPVIKIANYEDAVPLAGALIRGGIPTAEITFRTDAAAESIIRMKNAYPDMIVGAGTVLTVKQADAAIAAGAQFIVAPGFNPFVVDHCIERGIPVIPGCVTPTEIENAMMHGISVVKFFPASAFGGVSTIKALSAPYQNVKFVPTGGIGPANIGEYTALSSVLACGGSFMATEAMISSRDWASVTAKSRSAVAAAMHAETI